MSVNDKEGTALILGRTLKNAGRYISHIKENDRKGENTYLISGPGWLNKLRSWITYQLIQTYHQYGVGSRPAL